MTELEIGKKIKSVNLADEIRGALFDLIDGKSDEELEATTCIDVKKCRKIAKPKEDCSDQ